MSLVDMFVKPYIERFRNLKLTTPDNEIHELVKSLGFDDQTLVSQVMKAVRLINSNPEETVGDFVNNGGLLKLLTGQAGQGQEPETAILQCPHCNGTLFL